ncbi:MAG: radical SAM protein [Deltaproteobacteria bacterium]|nr:radical SAM protein [Deltaproteobacteria bacterium]
MKYLFGPVPSRRLGLSLGVDLVLPKTCPFDCIYCEVGRTTVKTMERREYIPAAAIVAELETYFSRGAPRPDYVTLAGSGEPTLNRGLGRIIARLKNLTDSPVAVLTNGALLHYPEVRRELAQADVILPSLDTVTPELFQIINRPAPGLRVDHLMAGLRALREEYGGQIWLEVLLLRRLNDTPEELAKLKATLELVRPDRIHLNTAVRPVVEDFALPLTAAELAEAASFLGHKAEVVASGGSGRHPQFDLSDGDFLASLARRPQTAGDLAEVMGLPVAAVVKRLDRLVASGRVARMRHQHDTFYQTN